MCLFVSFVGVLSSPLGRVTRMDLAGNGSHTASEGPSLIEGLHPAARASPQASSDSI
jgi:hypothetical protein